MYAFDRSVRTGASEPEQRSPRPQSVSQLQQMMDASPRVTAQAKFADEINRGRSAPIQLMKNDEFDQRFEEMVASLDTSLAGTHGNKWEALGKRRGTLLRRFLMNGLKARFGTTVKRKVVSSSTAASFDAPLETVATEAVAKFLDDQKQKTSAKRKARTDIEAEFHDSELDDSSDEELEEENVFHLDKDKPPSAKATTVLVGTERITGAELIALADEVVHAVTKEIAGDELPEYDPDLDTRVVHSGPDWLKALGTMDKTIPGDQRRPLHEGAIFKSMEHPIAPLNSKVTGKLAVGEAQSMMNFNLQNIMVRVSPEGGKDLEYKDLATELGALSGGDEDLQDMDIAESLLTLTQSGQLPDTNPLHDDRNALNLLNFTNTLGIGVEGSRLNANTFHHLEVLEEVSAGKLGLQDAFYREPFGGVFPMATTGAINQSGQLSVRRKGLIGSVKSGTRPKPRGVVKPWEKNSKKRGGRVGSLKGLRATQRSNPVILKEAQNLARVARRLRDSEGITDKATLQTALRAYIRDKMRNTFGNR